MCTASVVGLCTCFVAGHKPSKHPLRLLDEMHVCAAEYEVDFITYFTKIANLGAKFDSNKYLYPITLELPKIK